ncbi:hypothetical protein Brsp04_02559 [Brucella sp. NBRC 12952]|jgi:hypothetical protein
MVKLFGCIVQTAYVLTRFFDGMKIQVAMN